MQVHIFSDGRQIGFNLNLPATVLTVKKWFSKLIGISEQHLNLFAYPETPDQGPGLRLLADNHTFGTNMQNAHVSFVVTIGKESSWTCFYVNHQHNGQLFPLRFQFHRLETIGAVKELFADSVGVQANSFQLSLDGKTPLREDLNIFHSGVQNGSVLSPLKRLRSLNK